MADLSYLMSIPSRAQTDPTCPKVPTIDQVVIIQYLAWPKAPGKQRHSYWAKYVKCLEVISQELGKSVPDISLEWRGCTIQACMSSFTQAKWKYSKLMPFLFYCILTLSEFSRLKSSDNGNRVQRCATAPVFPRPHWVTLKHAPGWTEADKQQILGLVLQNYRKENSMLKPSCL